MNQASIPPTVSRSSRLDFLNHWLFRRAFFGGLAGLMCSSPGVDLTFDKVDIEGSWAVILMLLIFGIGGGLLLAWLNSRGGNKRGWLAIVKLPVLLVLGFLVLVAIVVVPIAIDTVARTGSQWLTGASGNNIVREVIGALCGVCLGLIIPPVVRMIARLSLTMR